jgi:hypothetical protein
MPVISISDKYGKLPHLDKYERRISAVDKLSKTFLVKTERVFSQDDDDVDICRMY